MIKKNNSTAMIELLKTSQDNKTKLSNSELAQKLVITEKQVEFLLKNLVDNKIIEIGKTKGRNSTRYIKLLQVEKNIQQIPDLSEQIPAKTQMEEQVYVDFILPVTGTVYKTPITDDELIKLKRTLRVQYKRFCIENNIPMTEYQKNL